MKSWGGRPDVPSFHPWPGSLTMVSVVFSNQVETLRRVDSGSRTTLHSVTHDSPIRRRDPGARMELGKTLGHYRILEKIGEGGMGEVYRAHDPRIGRDVAIKVLPATFAANPDRMQRFEREARAAGGLNHPNLVTIHELGTHAGSPYIVMELL